MGFPFIYKKLINLIEDSVTRGKCVAISIVEMTVARGLVRKVMMWYKAVAWC